LFCKCPVNSKLLSFSSISLHALFTACLKLHVDGNNALHDRHAGFIEDTADTVTTQCISADRQISSQRLVDDDLDDFTELPIFTKRSSRRLRRTSMEIYRKSLHDADNVASEEECDTTSVCQDTGTADATTTARVETASTLDAVLCDKLAILPTESENSVILPTTAVENVDIQSDVQTAKLPSITNSNGVITSTTGMVLIVCVIMWSIFLLSN